MRRAGYIILTRVFKFRDFLTVKSKFRAFGRFTCSFNRLHSYRSLSFSTICPESSFFTLSFFLSFSSYILLSFSPLFSLSSFLFLSFSFSLFFTFPRPDYWKPHARVSPLRCISPSPQHVTRVDPSPQCWANNNLINIHLINKY